MKLTNNIGFVLFPFNRNPNQKVSQLANGNSLFKRRATAAVDSKRCYVMATRRVRDDGVHGNSEERLKRSDDKKAR